MTETPKPPYHERVARKEIGQPYSVIDDELPEAQKAYRNIQDLLAGHEQELDRILRFASVVQWTGETYLDMTNFPAAIRNLLSK